MRALGKAASSASRKREIPIRSFRDFARAALSFVLTRILHDQLRHIDHCVKLLLYLSIILRSRIGVKLVIDIKTLPLMQRNALFNQGVPDGPKNMICLQAYTTDFLQMLSRQPMIDPPLDARPSTFRQRWQTSV